MYASHDSETGKCLNTHMRAYEIENMVSTEVKMCFMCYFLAATIYPYVFIYSNHLNNVAYVE